MIKAPNVGLRLIVVVFIYPSSLIKASQESAVKTGLGKRFTAPLFASLPLVPFLILLADNVLAVGVHLPFKVLHKPQVQGNTGEGTEITSTPAIGRRFNAWVRRLFGDSNSQVND